MLNGASATSTAFACRSHAVSEVMLARLLTVLLVALQLTAVSADPSLDNAARGRFSATSIADKHTGPHCATAPLQPGYQTRQSILTEVLVQIYASCKVGMLDNDLIETVTDQSQLLKATVISSYGGISQHAPKREVLV